MNRDAIVSRNKSMTDAFHAMPPQHHIRRSILNSIARFPIDRLIRRKIPTKQSILLIKPDHLGDVLLTTPAIQKLRQTLPDAEIHALVGPWSASVLADIGELDAVLTLPFPGFNRGGKGKLYTPYQQAIQTARHLHQINYASVIILRPDHWWGALVAFMAGIPQRIGYDLEDIAPFLTHRIPHEHQHAIMQNMRLIEQWTGEVEAEDVHYDYPIRENDQAYIDAYLTEWGIKPQAAIFCIHPGSGTWVKRWDDKNWATVADTLIDQLDAKVVFTGSENEMHLVKSITAQMEHEACIAVGDTEVGQLAALFARAKVVLGPDSGPMHLASAVHTPTVTLFGPADPIEFRPWGNSNKHYVLTTNIACQPCRVLDWGNDDPQFHPCVREITVGQVLNAARRAAEN